MSGFEHGVTVAFRIINAVVVAGVLWYLLKKYVLTAVKQTIAEREVTIRHLEQQQITLSHKYQQTAKKIDEEDALCSVLLEKARAWQTAVAKENEHQIVYAAERAQALKERLQKQQQTITFMHTQLPVATRALEQAEKKLTEEFSSTARGQEYVASVIDIMRHT